jgi:hypothetical protein
LHSVDHQKMEASLKQGRLVVNRPLQGEFEYDHLFVGNSVDSNNSKSPKRTRKDRYNEHECVPKVQESRSKCVGGGFGKTTGVFSVQRTVPHKSQFAEQYRISRDQYQGEGFNVMGNPCPKSPIVSYDQFNAGHGSTF